ncbi:hypothetical protein [Microvirga massiliensis]|uniref:hypothetical protein n=1 Tax=Microvirga massiliensis TaxID=1033741 RepID=UPI000A960B81|nr:hypothetical protein [Microvirga massiliensis]
MRRFSFDVSPVDERAMIASADCLSHLSDKALIGETREVRPEEQGERVRISASST